MASTTLSAALAPEEEAEIRLRLRAAITDTTTRHIEENRRALQFPHLSDVTQARHQAWLAYNLTIYGLHGGRRDGQRGGGRSGVHRRSRVQHLSGVALACLDCARLRGPSQHDVEELQALHPAGDMTASSPRRHATWRVWLRRSVSWTMPPHRSRGRTENATGTRRHGASPVGPAAGVVHVAAGRLASARASVEALPPPREWAPPTQTHDAHPGPFRRGGPNGRSKVIARLGE